MDLINMLENAVKIDETDRKILNILAENSRAKLTDMGHKLQLSADSVKKRVDRLVRDEVIQKFTIRVDDRKLGINVACHAYLKLSNATRERLQEFTDYLRTNVRVIVAISVVGDYDFYLVLVAKNVAEVDDIKNEIREKFKDIIADWRGVLVTKVYKLQEYKF